MIPKPEQTSRWASQEAAIKAEINEAKNTLDLIRMAHGRARLASRRNGHKPFRHQPPCFAADSHIYHSPLSGAVALNVALRC